MYIYIISLWSQCHVNLCISWIIYLMRMGQACGIGFNQTTHEQQVLNIPVPLGYHINLRVLCNFGLRFLHTSTILQRCFWSPNWWKNRPFIMFIELHIHVAAQKKTNCPSGYIRPIKVVDSIAFLQHLVFLSKPTVFDPDPALAHVSHRSLFFIVVWPLWQKQWIQMWMLETIIQTTHINHDHEDSWKFSLYCTLPYVNQTNVQLYWCHVIAPDS